MAPTTVRHHLRNVYVKLDVSNKAAITRLVGGKTGLTA
jgi:DNA-binding CsgD family transcriptional regulator